MPEKLDKTPYLGMVIHDMYIEHGELYMALGAGKSPPTHVFTVPLLELDKCGLKSVSITDLNTLFETFEQHLERIDVD